jgi:hypothetical protein
MATRTYTAIEKLYGLKLFQGTLIEASIPAHVKAGAVAFMKELKAGTQSV